MYRDGLTEDQMDGYMAGKKIIHMGDILKHRRANGLRNISGNWWASHTAPVTATITAC